MIWAQNFLAAITADHVFAPFTDTLAYFLAAITADHEITMLSMKPITFLAAITADHDGKSSNSKT